MKLKFPPLHDTSWFNFNPLNMFWTMKIMYVLHLFLLHYQAKKKFYRSIKTYHLNIKITERHFLTGLPDLVTRSLKKEILSMVVFERH